MDEGNYGYNFWQNKKDMSIPFYYMDYRKYGFFENMAAAIAAAMSNDHCCGGSKEVYN